MFLEAFQADLSVLSACKRSGVSVYEYRNWVRTDEDFRFHLDMIHQNEGAFYLRRAKQMAQGDSPDAYKLVMGMVAAANARYDVGARRAKISGEASIETQRIRYSSLAPDVGPGVESLPDVDPLAIEGPEDVAETSE